MLKLGGVGTILIVVFLFWALSGGSPAARMERGCQPIEWFGNVVTSMTALGSMDLAETTASGFAEATYGCEYVLWRLFYEDDWERAIEQGLIDPEDGHLRRQQDLRRQRSQGYRPPAGTPPEEDQSTQRPVPYPMERAQ